MASFGVVGLDEIALKLQNLGDKGEQIANEMLVEGAKVLIPYMKAEAQRVSNGERSVGTMADSIGMTAVKKRKTGGLIIHIYPQGDQPHGNPLKKKSGKVSNAAVGFMLEYGTSKMAARPWMKPANIKATDAVHEVMFKVWEKNLNV